MRRTIRVAVLVGAAVAVITWLGCQSGTTSVTSTSNQLVPSGATNHTSWEYKTVEKEISGDPVDQLRQEMREFQRGGWLVLSFSKPLPQADGTTHRKYELKRAKP